MISKSSSRRVLEVAARTEDPIIHFCNRQHCKSIVRTAPALRGHFSRNAVIPFSLKTVDPHPPSPDILGKYAATRYYDVDAFFVESSWTVQCFRTLVPLGLLSKASAEDRGHSEGPDDSIRARLRARAPTCAPEPCWKSTFSCSGSGRKPGGSGTERSALQTAPTRACSLRPLQICV